MSVLKIENCSFYSRENNVIIANLIDGTKKPLIRLKQNFIDSEIMKAYRIEYMENFMEMFPDLWEKIIDEPIKEEQLTLF